MPKLLIPAIAGGAALALVAGVSAATVLHRNDVELSVDGDSQSLQVRERTVGEVLDAQGIAVGAHDVVLPAADTAVTDGMEIAVSYGRELELTVDGETRTVWTTARTVGEALEQLRIDEPDAKLSATRGLSIGREGLDLGVETAKDVTLTVAGATAPVRLTGTVADALAEVSVTPDADDIVTPAADTPLADGMEISYVKVDVVTTVKEKAIAFEKTEVKSGKLDKGTEKVTTKGVDGVANETWTEIYRDDVLVTSRVTETEVVKEAVDQVTTVGTRVPAPKTSSSTSSGSDLTPATGNTCKASYYWQGQMTANGERFNTNDLTAAHKTYAFGTRVKVTNPKNGQSVIVRINDRGPYISGRCLDLSTAAMKAIGGTSAGVITVNYEVVG